MISSSSSVSYTCRRRHESGGVDGSDGDDDDDRGNLWFTWLCSDEEAEEGRGRRRDRNRER